MSHNDDTNTPRHHQTRFTKGRSGNSKGRPKGSKNFSTAFRDELNQCVPVTENGRTRKTKKSAVIAKQIVNQSAAGDLKAIPIALNQIGLIEGKEGGCAQPLLLEEDRLVIGLFYERMKYFEQEDEHE